MTTDVLMPEERLVVWHSGSDLELDSAGQWLFWVLITLGVDPPSLVSTVVALVPDSVSVVSIRVSVNIEASHSHISDVSNATVEPSNLLKHISSVEWLGNSGVMEVAPVVSIVLEAHSSVSVGPGSDGLGS